VILPYCTRPEFDRMTRSTPLRESMRQALRMVLVQRSTWAAAARRHQVTQSGMLKAMRRIAAYSTRSVSGGHDIALSIE
jgi:hypothetical protein